MSIDTTTLPPVEASLAQARSLEARMTSVLTQLRAETARANAAEESAREWESAALQARADAMIQGLRAGGLEKRIAELEHETRELRKVNAARVEVPRYPAAEPESAPRRGRWRR